MKFIRTLALTVLCGIMSLLCAADANAIMASASVDSNVIRIDEYVILYVEVLDDSRRSSGVPRVNTSDFEIAGTASSTRVSIQNGRISTTATYTYYLRPYRTGKFIIPSIKIESNGETAETQPISVEVLDDGSSSQKKKSSKKKKKTQPAYEEEDEDEDDYSGNSVVPPPQTQPQRQQSRKADDEVLLTASTDKSSAYPGEQVTLTITFYAAVPLSGNPQYQPPTFKNFISVDLPPAKTGNRRLSDNGPVYAFSEMKTALFALAPGKGDIEQATVSANIMRTQAMDPFDPNFIRNFMSGGGASTIEPKVLKSRPISIKIKPFPGGAPAGFNGAVGSYNMRSIVEKGTYKEGEPFTLTVTISGNGNLKSITAPEFPETSDFKVFDTQTSTTQNKTDDKAGGKKVFTYLIVPRSSGKKVVPALVFSYFDPSSGHYYTLKSKPVDIEVAKGETAAKSVYFNQSAPGEQVVAATAYDIKYVTDKNGLGMFGKVAENLASIPDWVHSIPAILLAGLIALRKFNAYRSKNPQLFRFKGAKGKAYRRIDEACEMIEAEQTSEAVSMLYDAFMDYLSNKCGEKVSALQSRKAIDVIKEKFPKIDDSELETIRSLWQELEMHHYAPGQVDRVSAEGLADRCRLMLKMLDGKMK